MKRNDRLSVALHVLLHMAERPDTAMTSAEMAACAGTHAVVVRRTFAGLREAGLVNSLKGHGGGWRLARPAADISVDDVQRALGERVIRFTPTEESPGCLVERALHRAVDGAVEAAMQVLDRRLATLTLADLLAETGPLPMHGHPHSGDRSHGL